MQKANSEAVRVVHLSTQDVGGGAPRAATRLHQALRRQGVDSLMLVAQKSGDDPFTQPLCSPAIYSLRRALDRLPLLLDKRENSVFASVGWLPHPKLNTLRRLRPDIIHLHWIHNGFVPTSWLATLQVPLVWTFHDMWPICGILHFEDEHTGRFLGAYSSVNRPIMRRGMDIDKWVWRRKRTVFGRARLVGVAPSRWIGERAMESALWKNRHITVIPNCLDTGVFAPMDRVIARQHLGLSEDKTIILYGAMWARYDVNKGFDRFRAALRELRLPPARVQVAIFGMDADERCGLGLPYDVRGLGYQAQEHAAAKVYSAADVMVVPSERESFGQTAVEAMACGKPVVAFDTSGLRDIILHRQTGYLAKPFNASDLAAGIRWVLANDGPRGLGAAARARAVDLFDGAIVAQRHMRLYGEQLTTPHGVTRP